MIISPNGFQKSAPEISPLKSDRTDLVEPHEGQGIVVMRLTKQSPISPLLVSVPCRNVITIQIYPDKQAVDKRMYNLFLFMVSSTLPVAFFACFSLLSSPGS